MYIALMFGIIKLPIVAIEIIALLQYSNLWLLRWDNLLIFAVFFLHLNHLI
jgi:hypothetical protein